ncbi:MAG: glycosyltransferase family 39 protein [Acidithiobacillales bacterium]
MSHLMRRVAVGILDVLLSVLLLAIIGILLTGGAEGHLGHISISAFTCSNLLLLGIPVFLLRYALRDWGPFLGHRSLSIASLPSGAERLLRTAHRVLLELDDVRAARTVRLVIIVSAILKALNAWFYYGFFSGDDVEVQEMSFARLFGWSWRAWELRSPFYPLAFLYPAQSLLFWLGVRDASVLIFAGRLVVIGFSCLNLYLVFRVARSALSETAPALIAVFFLAFAKLHFTFASSELPRTVASTFVLMTFWLLLETTPRRLVLAGALLGVGACMRFSEVVFVLPAVALLISRSRRSWKLPLAIFASSFLLTTAAILGPLDSAYWGKAFYSVRNFFTYTIIEGASSRGGQPWHWYLTHLLTWTDAVTFCLFLASVRRPPFSLLPWAGAPFIILSFLPHKEPRYLVPALPFITTSAAWVVWNLVGQVAARPAIRREDARSSRVALPLLAALCVGVLFELDGFRFRRSESGVEVGRFLAEQRTPGPVAIEQAWKAGGNLYLWPTRVEDIDTTRTGDPEYVRGFLDRPEVRWVALRDRSVRENGLAPLLEGSGFFEVRFSCRTQRAEYRLFRKSSGRAEAPGTP